MITQGEIDKQNAASASFASVFGTTFGAWQSVESALYHFYLGLFDAYRASEAPNAKFQRELANVVYHSPVHLETRIALIDDLVKFRIDDAACLSNWSTLLHKIKRRKQVRDKLAHWSKVAIWDSKNNKFLRFVLSPPRTDHRNTRDKDFGKSSGGALGEADIKRHEEYFIELANEIKSFASSCLRMLKPSL